MERLRGETLRDRLKRGPLPASEIRRSGAEVAEALAAAHERGILHCDIKPSNLFLTADSGAKVMDFGIARRVRAAVAARPASDESTISGTLPRGNSWPERRSQPEQVRGNSSRAGGPVLARLGPLRDGERPHAVPHALDGEIYAVILREKPALRFPTRRCPPPSSARSARIARNAFPRRPNWLPRSAPACLRIEWRALVAFARMHSGFTQEPRPWRPAGSSWRFGLPPRRCRQCSRRS
jgi:serine/threonine protein kinase